MRLQGNYQIEIIATEEAVAYLKLQHLRTSDGTEGNEKNVDPCKRSEQRTLRFYRPD